jgi:hypothetical protein
MKMSFKGAGRFFNKAFDEWPTAFGWFVHKQLREGPENLGHYIGWEIASCRDNPMRWLRHGFIRNGRALGGLFWLGGDTNLGSAIDETVLAQVAGGMCVPMTLMFIAEPALGRIFDKNDKNQPLVPIGSKTVNTTKLGYNIVGASVSLLTLDGLLHVPGGVQHLQNIDWETVERPVKEIIRGISPFLLTGASLVAAWGCFQAGAKDKPLQETFEKQPKLPKKTFLGRVFQDAEVSGTTKLLAENSLMITAAIGLQRPELLLSYLLWTAGNILLGTRRGIEIYAQEKCLIPPPSRQRIKELQAHNKG